MRAIDADALQLAIVEEGQANKRKKYIIGDIWELTGAEIREVINSQPTIQPDNNSENPNGSDAISRQAAIDATKKHYRAHDNDLLELIAFDIERLPSAEPKRGKWIHHPEIGWGETWLCDQCGEKTTSTVMGKPRANFCPMCGADMRKTT